MLTATNAMFNETRKGLTILWDYKFSMLVQLIGIGMVFIGVLFLTGQGELQPAAMASAMLGFIITYYAMETLSDMSYALMSEAQAGTLEQMYMSPAPSGWIVLGRSLASLVAATVQIVLIATILIVLLNISMPLRWEMLPVLLITMVGLLGFGYVIGGLTLVFKQVGPIANIVQNLVLFINGTFLPIALLPTWLAAIALAIPSTQGIVVMRQVGLEGLSLAEVWANGSLPFLVVHSVAFLFVGLGVFKYCERIARRQGTLGQY